MPTDKPAFDKDAAQRHIEESALKRERRLKREKKAKLFEAQVEAGIRMTPHGAFRMPGLKAATKRVDVFKFQRPIVTNDPEPKILVYNESHSWEGQLPASRELMQWFGDEFKRFAICEVQNDNTLRMIEGIVPDHDW